MMDPEEMQNNQGQDYNINQGLGNNLVGEENLNYEGEAGLNQYQQAVLLLPLRQTVVL